MLVTLAFTYLSLALNFGVLLLLHGSDPNLVTTKRNLQRSIQTIGSAATESWSTIAAHYQEIFSLSPASSASPPPFVDRAQRVYRGCAIRILRSFDGSVSQSSRTPTPTPSLYTSIPTSASTDIVLYTPLPPTCSPSNAPFVVDYAEHPWTTPGFVEVNLPRFWSLFLGILVSLVICVWFKVVLQLLFPPPTHHLSPRLVAPLVHPVLKLNQLMRCPTLSWWRPSWTRTRPQA